MLQKVFTRYTGILSTEEYNYIMRTMKNRILSADANLVPGSGPLRVETFCGPTIREEIGRPSEWSVTLDILPPKEKEMKPIKDLKKEHFSLLGIAVKLSEVIDRVNEITTSGSD